MKKNKLLVILLLPILLNSEYNSILKKIYYKKTGSIELQVYDNIVNKKWIKTKLDVYEITNKRTEVIESGLHRLYKTKIIKGLAFRYYDNYIMFPFSQDLSFNSIREILEKEFYNYDCILFNRNLENNELVRSEYIVRCYKKNNQLDFVFEIVEGNYIKDQYFLSIKKCK